MCRGRLGSASERLEAFLRPPGRRKTPLSWEAADGHHILDTSLTIPQSLGKEPWERGDVAPPGAQKPTIRTQNPKRSKELLKH